MSQTINSPAATTTKARRVQRSRRRRNTGTPNKSKSESNKPKQKRTTVRKRHSAHIQREQPVRDKDPTIETAEDAPMPMEKEPATVKEPTIMRAVKEANTAKEAKPKARKKETEEDKLITCQQSPNLSAPPAYIAELLGQKSPPKEKARGRKAAPYLKAGQLIHNRLKVERILGGGGFGQVFKALDVLHDNKPVAVKVEPRDRDAGRMILEQRVLSALRGTKHSPTLIASGMIDEFMYIAMEMLGRNMHDLRLRHPKRRFNAFSTMTAGRHTVQALRAVHDVGYLHRDVKPANLCVGVEQRVNTVYLVDFGMTRRFRDSNGVRRKERSYAGFRGTMRYVSVTVHERHEQGPNDDLWSLMYTLIELGEGSLPWRHIDNDDDMAAKKKNTPLNETLMNLPRDFKAFAAHLESLTYDSTPDYQHLAEVCAKCMPGEHGAEHPLDWEDLMPQRSNSLEKDSASER